MKVAVIGSGPAGMLCALEYARLNWDVTVFERGRSLDDRNCPDVNCRICPNRADCAILCGEAGAGGYSDGKLTLSTGRGVQVQGELDFMNHGPVLAELDGICTSFNSNSTFYKPIRRPDILEGTKFDFESYPLRFYGTDEIRTMFKSMREYMVQWLGVEFYWNTEVLNVYPERESSQYSVLWQQNVRGSKVEYTIFDRVVLAAGSHSRAFSLKLSNSLRIQLDHDGPAGLGIRLECNSRILEPMINSFYDFKLYLTSDLGQMGSIPFRSFCVNRGGVIVNECRPNGVISINGRSQFPQTDRSNMAIIARLPGAKMYVTRVAEHINNNAGGLPGYQSTREFMCKTRQGIDLPAYRTAHGVECLRNSRPAPLGGLLPPELVAGFRNYIAELDRILPGVVDDPSSLVIAPEVKYHMPRWPLGEGYEVVGSPNFQVIGNSAGYTDSISTAATMGIVAAHFGAKK